jgi:N-acetylmuramoyl-L-alanine amidase
MHTLLRRGDRGSRVAVVRAQLAAVGLAEAASAPGEDPTVFDDRLELAVRHFQQRRSLAADGVVGRETTRALDAARWRLGDRILRYTPGHLVVGDDVVELQQRLAGLGLHTGRVDGLLGPDTERAVRELQRASGEASDGVCGPATLRVLAQLARTVTGGDPVALRAQEDVRRAGPHLAGRVVVVDPAGGGEHRGVTGHGLDEADVALGVAQRLEGRLAAVGVTAVLTRGAHQDPDLTARVALAEAVGADLFVSLCCDAAAGTAANGTATSYWGTGAPQVRSPVGARLADLVQREVTARTPLVDLGAHARTYDVLRLTRMPAVLVDLGYLSSPHDAAVLSDERHLGAVADGLLAAVQRLVLPEEQDAATGTLFLGSFDDDRGAVAPRP